MSRKEIKKLISHLSLAVMEYNIARCKYNISRVYYEDYIRRRWYLDGILHIIGAVFGIEYEESYREEMIIDYIKIKYKEKEYIVRG